MTGYHRLSELVAEMKGDNRRALAELRALHGSLAKLDDRWDIDAGAKAKGRRINIDVTESVLAKIRGEFEARRLEYDRLVADLTRPHLQPPGQEAELKRQAAWSRMVRHLDALPASHRHSAAVERLERAVAEGDRATVEAGRRELGDYLAPTGNSLSAAEVAWLDLNSGLESVATARAIAVDNDQRVERMAWNFGQATRSIHANGIPHAFMSTEDGKPVFTDVADYGDKALAAHASEHPA